jgi:predicted nucleotidyltransferase
MAVMIEERHLKIIRNILQDIFCDADIYVFGSRAKGRAGKYSDLDLAIDCNGVKMPLTITSKLEVAFEDSLLPYKVDVVDLNGITPEFRQAIEGDLVRL